MFYNKLRFTQIWLSYLAFSILHYVPERHVSSAKQLRRIYLTVVKLDPFSPTNGI